MIGATVVLPLLRLLAGQQIEGPPEAPRPVTTGRRLLGMLCGLLAVMLVDASLNALARFINQTLELPYTLDSSRLPFCVALAFGQFALIWAAVGERSIRVRPAPSTQGVTTPAKLMRWALGIGGLSRLNVPGTGFTGVLALLLAMAKTSAAVFSRRHRGLAYAAADLGLVDARRRGSQASEPRASD